jgi:hypothetical protein
MAVDSGLWASRGPHADARLRADARGRDGGIREKLAAGMTPLLHAREQLSGRLARGIDSCCSS